MAAMMGRERCGGSSIGGLSIQDEVVVDDGSLVFGCFCS